MFGLFKRNTTNAWQALTAPQQLDTQGTSTLIFKHSTRCAISSMALSRLTAAAEDLQAAGIQLLLLDLLAHQDISQQIAERWDIPHQSPQVLLIQDGRCIYDASHSEIRPEVILNQISA